MVLPPRLPSAHSSTALKIRIDIDSPILLVLSDTGADISTLSLSKFEDELYEITTQFIDARIHGVEQPDFRAEIKKFSSAIETFLPLIPEANAALVNAITNDESALRSKSGSQHEPGNDPGYFGTAFTFSDPISFSKLKEGMLGLSHRLTVLSREEGVGRKGRPANRPDHLFVRHLKTLFTESSGSHPTRGYDWDSNEPRIRHFEQFVRAVEGELIGQGVGKLTTQKTILDDGGWRTMTQAEAEREFAKFRLGPLDHLIRQVIENN